MQGSMSKEKLIDFLQYGCDGPRTYKYKLSYYEGGKHRIPR